MHDKTYAKMRDLILEIGLDVEYHELRQDIQKNIISILFLENNPYAQYDFINETKCIDELVEMTRMYMAKEDITNFRFPHTLAEYAHRYYNGLANLEYEMLRRDLRNLV